MKKIYFLLILSLVFVSCRKNKASWDSDYVVPLINDSLDLSDYVNDSTLGVNAFGFYEMNLKRELLQFDLNSEISIPDTLFTSNFTSAVSLSIPPGFSFVNDAQEKNFSIDNLELTKVILRKGKVVVKVFNPYPTDVICNILLPTTTLNGVQITDNLSIGPGTIANPTMGTKTIDISDSRMDLRGVAGNSFNKLTYQITVNSDPNGATVSTTTSHVTNVKTELKDVEIFYARGYFGNRILSDTVETNVEVLEKWVSGDLDLQNVNLNLALTNSIKAMGRITIKEMTTTKFDGTTTSLSSSQINVPQNVNPGTGEWETLTPSVLNFPFTSTNSNIETFLENAGSKIKVIYEFELNPLGNITGSSNEIFPHSEAKLDLSIDMPINLGMTDLTLRDTIDVDLTKSAKQIGQAQSAEIVADIENGFPFQGKILMSVLNEQNETILTIINDQKVESSAYGTPNSLGLSTQKSKLIWKLDKADIEKLKLGKRMIISGVFNTPDPNSIGNMSVQIHENSFLATQIKLFLTYQNEL